MKRDNRKRARGGRLLALSAVVGTVIAVAVTAVAGGTLYTVFQQQVDLQSGGGTLEVRNLSAFVRGDTLVVAANIRNMGSTNMDDFGIRFLNAGDLEIQNLTYQNPDLTFASATDTQPNHAPNHATPSGNNVDTNHHAARNEIVAGGTKALALDITHDVVSSAVKPNARLTMVVNYYIADDTYVADAVTTRVKAG